MPDRVYLLYDDRSYTFRELEQGTSTIKMNETWHLLLCMHILKTQLFFLHSYQSISTHLLQNDKTLQSQLTSINHLTYDVGALATCAGHQEGRKCVANDNNDWSSFLTFIFTDIVCVMQQNHPCILIALWATLRIGAVPALINNNLSQDPLLHCLTVAKTSLLLFDRVYEPLVATVAEAAKEKGINSVATEFDNSATCQIAPCLTPSTLRQFSATDEDIGEACLKGITPYTPCVLIYTRYVRKQQTVDGYPWPRIWSSCHVRKNDWHSGTTGMPKAAIVPHVRINGKYISLCFPTCEAMLNMYVYLHNVDVYHLGIMRTGAILAGRTPDDIEYCCLPLYHGTGCKFLTSRSAKLVCDHWNTASISFLAQQCSCHIFLHSLQVPSL